MKAKTHWWADHYNDDPPWVGNLLITIPEGGMVEFSCGCASKEEATNWCALLDEHLEGIGVGVRSGIVFPEDTAPVREEAIIESTHQRIEALEMLIRVAYPALSPDLRRQAEELLKPTEDIVESETHP